jgi:hypothetical protein
MRLRRGSGRRRILSSRTGEGRTELDNILARCEVWIRIALFDCGAYACVRIASSA